MKPFRIIALAVLATVVAAAIWFYHRGYIRVGKPAVSAAKEKNATAGQRRILYWVDPMNPGYKSDKPGKSPFMDMQLVPVYADDSSSAAAQAVPSDAIKIDPDKQQLIGVQLGQVEVGPAVTNIRAVGQMAYDETKIGRVHTKIAGWIDQVFVDYTGQLVKKGQPLFTIYSPDLVSTEEEFLIGLRAKQYLADSQFKEVSTGALSLFEAARQRLRLWDISDEQIQTLERTRKPVRDLTLYAPYDGFVVKRNAFPKQQITPDTEVYELADLSSIWVIAQVYEYELPEIQLGQTAKITLTYFPGKTYVGKVSYIYPDVDNTTRTAQIRIELPNPDFILKPDMYANVELEINYGTHMTIPQEAVLDSGNQQTVFVALGNGYFEPRMVQLGARLRDRVVVLSGLKPHETVVTSGNFLIDSESQLKEGISGMAGMPGMEQPKQEKPNKEMPGMPEMKQPKPSKSSEEMPAMPGMDHSKHPMPENKKKAEDKQ